MLIKLRIDDSRRGKPGLGRARPDMAARLPVAEDRRAAESAGRPGRLGNMGKRRNKRKSNAFPSMVKLLPVYQGRGGPKCPPGQSNTNTFELGG